MTRRSSISPSMFCSLQMPRPRFLATWNGPSHKCWKLVCFHLGSFSLSHFRTRSPSSNILHIAECLSNHFFNVSFPSLRFIERLIRFWIVGKFYPLASWVICRKGKRTFSCRMNSCPSTKKYSEVPRVALGVTLSTHRAWDNALWQFIWWSTIVFFNILISFC